MAEWQLVVVGAGAAGLLGAARAAELGLRTLLLEKNRKPGVKILMSGGTRCNLTQNTDARGIATAYGRQGRFLHSALAALGPADLVALIEAEGVMTKVEPTGKIFPVSDRALDVQQALLARLAHSGAALAVEEPLTSVERAGSAFTLQTSQRTLHAERLLLTTGGLSYPGSGTTGDGYAWARKFGHTIVPPRPALAPITANPAWLPPLRGITLPDVKVHVREPGENGKYTVLDERRDSFLFAHFGLSGPAVLDASRVVSGHADPRKLELVCDLLPSLGDEAFDARLRAQAAADGKKQLPAILAAVAPELPRRLIETLIELAGQSLAQRGGELGKDARRRLVQTFKHLAIPITGTMGFKKAEVTAGGVALGEVDSRTMQSKLVPNLYFAGEILDLDGPIGGYNFQAAFSTAWLAAERMGAEGEG